MRLEQKYAQVHPPLVWSCLNSTDWLSDAKNKILLRKHHHHRHHQQPRQHVCWRRRPDERKSAHLRFRIPPSKEEVEVRYLLSSRFPGSLSFCFYPLYLYASTSFLPLQCALLYRMCFCRIKLASRQRAGLQSVCSRLVQQNVRLLLIRCSVAGWIFFFSFWSC